jgi:hypothetical protein
MEIRAVDYKLTIARVDDPQVYAQACTDAERVLPIFERRYPGDNRLRSVVETARRFASGEATVDEMVIARNCVMALVAETSDNALAAKEGSAGYRAPWAHDWARETWAANQAVVAARWLTSYCWNVPGAGTEEAVSKAAQLAEEALV